MAQQQTGTIIATKMEKTAIVVVERTISHPVYKKIMKRTKRYKADTEGISVKDGDRVVIEETRPMSADKRFRVIKVLPE